MGGLRMLSVLLTVGVTACSFAPTLPGGPIGAGPSSGNEVPQLEAPLPAPPVVGAPTPAPTVEPSPEPTKSPGKGDRPGRPGRDR